MCNHIVIVNAINESHTGAREQAVAKLKCGTVKAAISGTGSSRELYRIRN
jgi:hypothetical protein